MKKKVLSLAILMAGLVGCSQSEDVINIDKPSEVKNLSLTLSTSALTRAAGSTAMGSDQSVTFNEGYLYFVSNENYSIVHRVKVESTPIPAGTETKDSNGRTVLIGLTGEETEETIEKIPVEEGYDVFMVGNPSATISQIVGGNFQQVENAVISALSENRNADGDIDGGVANVTLYGYGLVEDGETETIPGDEENTEVTTYKAVVEVGPAVTARIEIPYLEAAGDVDAFTLKGIYIGRTYLEVGLNGVAVESTRIGDTSNAEDLLAEYEDLPAGILHDELNVPSTSGQVAAGTGRVWAYNVLTYNPHYAAGNNDDLTAIEEGLVSNVPSIVFVIEDVEAAPDAEVYFDNEQPYYITVQGFLGSDQAEIQALKPGYIYSLSAGVSVDSNTLTDKPNVSRVNVDVEVKLMGWTDENVAPII